MGPVCMLFVIIKYESSTHNLHSCSMGMFLATRDLPSYLSYEVYSIPN